MYFEYPSDPGAADKGLYWNSLPFGELLWIRMGIHLRIYKDSPNSRNLPTEFQGMNRILLFAMIDATCYVCASAYTSFW